MKKITSLTLILLVLVSLFSCSAKGEEDNSYSGASEPGYYPMENGTQNSKGEDTLLTEDRKIIKTVNQTLQTENFDQTLAHISALVTELGGYTSSSTYTGSGYYNEGALRHASLTVKIPADKLSDFNGGIENGAVVVKYNESATDVTEAYIDVESKIAVYEAEEAALLEMLSKSVTVSTTLEIRTRLNEVQYSLASLRAQKNSYDNRVAYSTVYLTVDEVRQVVSKNPGFFEQVGANFSDSIYNIGNFFRSFAIFLIGDFLYILLFAAILALATFAFKKIRKKKGFSAQDNEKSDEQDGGEEPS